MESRRVVRYTIADCAKIKHVHDTDHVAQEERGDVFDLNIINAYDATAGSSQINPEMPVQRGDAPRHINAVARAGADNCGDFDDLTIGGESNARPGFHDAGHIRAPGPASPGCNAHAWEVPAQHFQAGFDL